MATADDIARAKETIEILADLATSTSLLSMVLRHDLGMAHDGLKEIFLEKADRALMRFEMLDPVGFAAVVRNEQEEVDRIRAQQGLDPEQR